LQFVRRRSLLRCGLAALVPSHHMTCARRGSEQVEVRVLGRNRAHRQSKFRTRFQLASWRWLRRCLSKGRLSQSKLLAQAFQIVRQTSAFTISLFAQRSDCLTRGLTDLGCTPVKIDNNP
jgi:hypothetical protein